ncbi:MAG: manganese efflux pump MntP family protein [Bacteroidetes bacterium]|nr:manganese efflux pump MntP family protein [Bacteroidota bacterium]
MLALRIILITASLTLLCFSVAMKMGFFRCQSYKEAIRSSLSLTVFMTGLFTLGWLISYSMHSWLEGFKQVPGLVILFLLGLKTIYFSRIRKEDPTLFDTGMRGVLLAVSFAAGLNGLIAGLALPIIGVGLFPLVALIPGTVFLLSISGVYFGKMRGNLKLAQWMEFSGGFLLIVLVALEIFYTIKAV